VIRLSRSGRISTIWQNPPPAELFHARSDRR